jgi:5-methylcytosine-specific restriction endonuclease McrA
MDKSRYPDDWDAISLRIRNRDGQRCTQCGVPNGVLIYRDPDDKAKYTIVPERVTQEDVIRIWGGRPIREVGKTTRVVLTVHHIGAPKSDGSPGDRHDKMDCRDENLTSLCQRCHFIADIDIHREKANISRRANKAKRLAAMQQSATIDF